MKTKIFIGLFLLTLTTYAVSNRGIEDKIFGHVKVIKEGKDYRTYFSDDGLLVIKEACREVIRDQKSE